MSNGISRRGFLAMIAAAQAAPNRKSQLLKTKIPSGVPTPQNFTPWVNQDWAGPVSFVPVGAPVDPFAPLENLDPDYSLAQHKKKIRELGIRSLRIDDGIKPLSTPNTEFRYHQVEQLLGQVAVLLERGIATRAEWQGLGEKSLATQLQLQQFSDLDDVHAAEVTSGYYAFPSIQSTGEYIAQCETDPDPQQRIIDNVAEIASKGLSGNALPSDLPNAGARMQAAIAEANQWASWDRATAACSKAAYDNVDIGFRRSRTEAARRINAMRFKAFTDQGGLINFEERRTVLQDRFKQDFQNALARIPAIKQGLDQLYGYSFPAIDSNSIFDSTLISVRAAMEWLLRFSAQEQNYILPLSVRSLVGSKWADGLDTDQQGGKWNLTIPLGQFPSQAHVRLRGISVTVDSDDANALFQSLVKVPQRGTVVHLDGSSATLDQSAAPATRIGRVQRLDSQRAPDTVGSLSLHNVSPIGEWAIAVGSSAQPLSFTPSSTPTIATKMKYSQNVKVKDVILHITLAIRTI
ncbi:MAG TPA: hypothetical protein VM554_05680 [Acidisarcina sp.]|nr:hypothetical protein [Acidisarcina sp.]